MKRVRFLLWVAAALAAVAMLAAQRLDSSLARFDGGQETTKGTLGKVPSFALTDQTGARVSASDLRGTVWVASFIFTRCASACPLLTAKFKALQAALGPLPGVRFVSISVDPEHDTPEVLAAYARRFEADTRRWSFLTGPLTEIEKTVVRGFKIHIGEPRPNAADPTLIDIMHGEHFVLVDGGAEIRGYYRSDEAGLAELQSDLKSLIR